MNLEGLTIKLLAAELAAQLLGSKITKISMPTPRSLLLLARRGNVSLPLFADCSGGASLCIAAKMPENPAVPPAFCMLLRKHLEEGRINKISQSGLDRVLTLEIDLLGNSSQIITRQLIFELTGKNSNIILVQDGLIIDALRHIGAAQSSYRSILPGRTYLVPPPREGLDITTAAPAALAAAAAGRSEATMLAALIAAAAGIGKVTAAELLARAGIPLDQHGLKPAQQTALAGQIAALQEQLEAPAAVYALIGRTNQVKAIAPLPPQQLEAGMRVQEFATVNAAINFAATLTPIQLPEHEQLRKTVAAESAHLQKKLPLLERELRAAQAAETQRVIADTLMANLYQLHKGSSSASLRNLYTDEPLTIALSPLLSPNENAQAYYKRYNKLKRAQTEVQRQLDTARASLAYLASLEVSLLTASSKNEVAEIKQEMLASGLLKNTARKKTKTSLPQSRPLRIKLHADAEVYVGKNNRQNDYLTFSLGTPNDLWLHTKDIPGSHVLLKTALPQPRQEDIAAAAQIAAYFSKDRNGSNVPVDCTLRRYVKKPHGSKPGFVIFTHQTTLYTTPDATELKKYLGMEL